MEPLKLEKVYTIIGHREVPKEIILATEIKILTTIKSLWIVTPFDFLTIITENLHVECEEEQNIK